MMKGIEVRNLMRIVISTSDLLKDVSPKMKQGYLAAARSIYSVVGDRLIDDVSLPYLRGIPEQLRHMTGKKLSEREVKNINTVLLCFIKEYLEI